MKKNIKKSLTLFIFILFFVSAILPAIDAAVISEIAKNDIDEEEIINEIEKNIFDFGIKEEYALGQIIVRFKEDIDISAKKVKNHVSVGINSINFLNEKYQVKNIKRLSDERDSFFENIYVFTFNDKIDINSVIEEYDNDENIEYAEPNYLYYTCDIPNDPSFDNQWALNQISDYDIDAPEAWDIQTGNSDVVIAVIDTGVDYTHSDLANNIWINKDEIPNNHRDDDLNGYVDDVYGWDFYNDDNDPMDDNGHGTHCSGIASAVTNNNIGIAGVSWNCKIMPIKFLGESGNGTTEAGVKAIKYAANNGADVISMSWGGGLYSFSMETALAYANLRGAVLVAAAGNSNTDKKSYPAGYKNVIAVAATDKNDYRASFSNYGDWVDVAAPGVDILSSIPDDKYESYSGTSMACPHVSGLAGLIFSNNKDIDYKQVRTIIEYSVDRIDPYDLPMKRGRVNAKKAMLRGTGSSTAIITNPKHGSEVEDIIDITGSAKGEGFQYYTIEYTTGWETGNPSWVEITNSATAITNQNLCSLDTTKLNEGFYTIRLTVICSNGVYEDSIWIIVNNEKNTIYVDDDGGEGIDQTSIRRGIYDAGWGDSVYVYEGIYNEDVKIYKTIVLTGENLEKTIINGTGLGDVVFVNADNVVISGFTIQNSGTHRGVYFRYAKGNQLIGNKITDNWVGIKLSYSSGNTIKNNQIIDNLWIGLLLTRRCVGNKIIDNNFINSFPLFYIHAYFRNSYLTKWKGNYWDNWIGLKIRLLRWKPKRICGKIFDLFPRIYPEEMEEIFHGRITLRANYDWKPALEPNEI